MDPSSIHRVWQDIEHLQELSLTEIEELCERYPWFSMAHALRARKLRLLNDAA